MAVTVFEGIGELECPQGVGDEAEDYSESKRYNPRYLAYCQAQGRRPVAQLSYDEARTGAEMTGFTLWVGERWVEWTVSRGLSPDTPVTASDHEAFDEWLGER